MSESNTDARALPCQVLKRVLSEMTDPSPGQVISEIERCISGGFGLPPRVFFQTTEQALVAVSITDPDANILYANAAFERVTGYSRDEVVGRNESILSYKTTPRGYYERMWKVITAGKNWTGRLVNRRKDGSRYIAELTISPVLDDAGKILYYLGVHRDITEMRSLQHQVASQKALIETVVDLAPVAFALMDDQGRVVLDNHEYKKLHSSFDGKEPARAVLDTLLGSDAGSVREAQKDFSDREFVVERRGGVQRWYSCSGVWFDRRDTSADSFFEAGNHRYLLLVMDDITPHKRRQEEQRVSTLRAMLAEGEMVQSLRETIAGAIYQLQGPVNLIEAALKMAQRRVGTAEFAPLIGVLREALESGQQAVDRLRNSMPGEEQESSGPINFNEIVRDVLMVSTGALLSAGVSVEWKPAPVLPTVAGRATAFRTMLKQLVDNSIQAMVTGRSRERELRIITGGDAEGVRVVVEDTGPGIPENLRHKVFEPFFSTSRPNGRSTGMGLALAQEVVSRHGGTLRIDPHYDRGCRFEIFLPCANREIQ